MKPRDNDTVQRHNAVAIALCRNEGESGREPVDRQYGRRIEMDRSWTVYHVFTGVPVRADGHVMTGLSRSDATSGMLSLNLRVPKV